MTNPGNVQISLPVKIPYMVLEEFLQEKMIGEIIKKESSSGKVTNYAQILNIFLQKSDLEAFDIAVEIRFQTLTSIFKNKQASAIVHCAIALDKENQRIFISDYKVDGKTHNWFADTLLETVFNNWMYAKVKKKMNFDFLPQIQGQLTDFNSKLENQIEAIKGINLSGNIDSVEISEIKAEINHFLIFLSIAADISVSITKLDFSDDSKV